MRVLRFVLAYCIALGAGGATLYAVLPPQPDIIQPESMYDKVAPRGDKVLKVPVRVMLTPQESAFQVFRLGRPDWFIKRAKLFSGADLWPPPALR